MKIYMELENDEHDAPIKFADAIINFCHDKYDYMYRDQILGEIAEHIQVYLKYKSMKDREK